MIDHSLRRHSQEVLIDCKVTGSGCDDGDVQTCSIQITIDVVLVERVQGEVDSFKHVAFVRLDSASSPQLR